MRILYIITQGECGGAQKNVLDLAVNTKRLGNQVFICTGKQNNVNDGWLFNKLKENGFAESELFILNNLQREINLGKDLKVLREAYNFIKKINPHITHIHGTKAGIICSIAAKLAKSKVIYTIHGFVFSEKLNFFKKNFYLLLEFLTAPFRDLNITVSNYDKNIGKKLKVINNKNSITIYNGIDKNKQLELLDKSKAREKILNLVKKENNNDLKIIGVVANLYKNKGINYLIEATEICLAHDKNLLFIIIGNGPEKNNLTDLIHKNHLENNVFLVGVIDDAYKYLKAFDLITLPSTKEGFPYILLESLLANVPFLATNVGGVPEIAEYNNLELIPHSDKNAISDSIINFLKGTSSPSIIFPEKFTLENMFHNISREYRKIAPYQFNEGINNKSFLITLPAYNESSIIKNTILKIDDYLNKNYKDLLQKNLIKMCIAINGSTDSTESIIKQIKIDIPYLDYTVTKQKGRGGALDNTWKNAKEDILLYLDSDLAYSLEDLGKMINSYIDNENFDLVVASRRIEGSIVIRHPVRRFLTEGYNRLIKILFINEFTDAQAGCKSVNNKTYQQIRKNIYYYKGWFFDTALLIYAEKNNYKIKDISITCIDNRKWRLKLITTVLYFLKNIFALRIKTLFKGYK